MRDKHVNWRNHRWFFDSDYAEREAAPILTTLILRHGSFFDETFKYMLIGKAKQYIIRFPHYNGRRNNPRILTEKPRARDTNHKLSEFILEEG